MNVWLTNALKPHGYHYAPDPSSQGACTIGGNVATNSRWAAHAQVWRDRQPHSRRRSWCCPTAALSYCGGPTEDTPGYDLDRHRRRQRRVPSALCRRCGCG